MRFNPSIKNVVWNLLLLHSFPFLYPRHTQVLFKLTLNGFFSRDTILTLGNYRKISQTFFVLKQPSIFRITYGTGTPPKILC